LLSASILTSRIDLSVVIAAAQFAERDNPHEAAAVLDCSLKLLLHAVALEQVNTYSSNQQLNELSAF
jgi:hypothetical protein